jgi:hypothetical protein
MLLTENICVISSYHNVIADTIKLSTDNDSISAYNTMLSADNAKTSADKNTVLSADEKHRIAS